MASIPKGSWEHPWLQIQRLLRKVLHLRGQPEIRPVRRTIGWPRSPLDRFTDKRIVDDVMEVHQALADTREYLAAEVQALGKAMRSLVEIRAAVIDPDQVRTLLDLARSGDKGQFVELARCLGVPAERAETLWQGTVRRLPDPPEREEPARCCEERRGAGRVEGVGISPRVKEE